MKKALTLALCLTLAGLLAVNGTFADDFGKAINELFQQVAELAQLAAPTTDPEQFKVSLVYLNDNSEPLFPGSTISRQAAVRHSVGSSDACFRLAIAVQTEAFSHLTLTLNEHDYIWSGWRNVTIDGCAYKLNIATYPEFLEPEETSPAALYSVSLDIETTSAQISAFRKDFIMIKALAVNADDFKQLQDEAQQPLTPTGVLDKALPITDTFNPF